MCAIKTLKMEWNEEVEQRLNKLNELDELRLREYESSAIYNEKMKNYNDQKTEKRELTVGDMVGYACFQANSNPSGQDHSLSLKCFHMEHLSWRIRRVQSSRSTGKESRFT